MPTLFESARQKRHFRLLPLWTLIWFVFLLGVLKIAADRYYTEATELFASYDRKMVEWIYEDEFKDDLKIIMLGNSRLRNALLAGGAEPGKVTLPDGRRAVILQFSNDAASFADYDTVTDMIVEKEPDIVVVQDSVMTNRHVKYPFIASTAESLLKYTEIAMQSAEPFELWVSRRSDLTDACFESFAKYRIEDHINMMQRQDRHMLAPENELHEKAIEFIEALVERDVPVAVLDIKSNTELLRDAGYSAGAVDFFGLAERPQKSDLLPALHQQVYWLSFNPPADGRDVYCDVVHLNDKGRERFKNWIVGEMATIMAAEDRNTAP